MRLVKYVGACFSLIAFSVLSVNKIYIFPPSGYANEKLFDLHNSILNRDDCMLNFYELRQALQQRGFHFKTAQVGDGLSDAYAILTSETPRSLVNYLRGCIHEINFV